jgi:twinkle protein
LALTDKAFKFFETRGITVDVLNRNRIAVERVHLPQVEEESNCLAFPYFRGGFVNIKYRSPDKIFRQI